MVISEAPQVLPCCVEGRVLNLGQVNNCHLLSDSIHQQRGEDNKEERVAALVKVVETINIALQPLGSGLRTTPMRICDDTHFCSPSGHSAVSPNKGRARFRNSRSVHKATFVSVCKSVIFPFASCHILRHKIEATNQYLSCDARDTPCSSHTVTLEPRKETYRGEILGMPTSALSPGLAVTGQGSDKVAKCEFKDGEST